MNTKSSKQPSRSDGSAEAAKQPRGRGAMRDVQLNIDPRIDLTKPIYEQVLALRKADAEADAA